MLQLLFFCSGVSGLIYQVIWVRSFGNVFGNTIYSASLVVAVFMAGLGAGSYLVGAWSDRRYATQPESLLRTYGYVELVIGLMGLAISALLPHLGQLSALVSTYSRDPVGWFALSATSYLARAAIVIVLLTPITLLMGGTLTLLIRHLVRSDLSGSGWRIAVLYASNTAGAALGCFLTDFTLVPAVGLQGTQMVAVGLNVTAGVGALYLASRKVRLPSTPLRPGKADTTRSRKVRQKAARTPVRLKPDRRPLILTSLALAMSGVAAMGMEMLWLRHFSILLGGFRAVFSLLLTVILMGIGVGSLIGGVLNRRIPRPAEWFMAAQALFVVATLIGLATADARPIEAAAAFDPTVGGAIGFAGAASTASSSVARALAELWFNARPILLEVGIPALLMGLSFPLANAVIQRAEDSVGTRAGALYLGNTVGGVAGSLAAGFLLLPSLGIQTSATVLAIVAAFAVIPLYFSGLGTRDSGLAESAGSRIPDPGSRVSLVSVGASLLVAASALAVWMLLPSAHVNTRALHQLSGQEQLLTVAEGLTEIIAVTEVPGEGRRLLTNGHPMSSTSRLSQRYMRGLAHIPLLAMANPQSVLVIGFGVGNTTHAATLHPSIRRVEVADLSRGILSHADYFADVNHHVLGDSRVTVYVNDGRQHLQMQPESSYDLVTLEPPPIAYAGVAALYSSEFYELVRSRLKPGGYASQWLPAYQVPSHTTLAMIRAFIDVFPQAVLVSGAEAELLLLGVNDSRIEIDPAHLAAALARAPAVEADLRRLDLGSVREIVGAFVASPRTLHEATSGATATSDDHPMQEYDVRSLLNLGEAVPASVVDLSQVASWCPRCFVDGATAPIVDGLDTYLGLLDLAYRASPSELARVRRLAGPQRVIAGSAYLGAVVPESAEAHNLLGIAHASRGAMADAVSQFREALRLEPDSAVTHWHLGAALAATGAHQEALDHLRRSVELDPSNELAQNDLKALTRLAERP
ncbi:MAG TPA: tetratricopeptide repeat protein [Vicinamibacterales bacterium]|nr:tetratricopeptide repeat protein [Vicinamibacterales bacterium]